MKSRRLLLIACSVAPFAARASGFAKWSFGMSRDEVKAVRTADPYYSFRNGDLGSQSGPFVPGRDAPISFYFKSDRLVRIMLMPYMGEDFTNAREAWTLAAIHITALYGGIELGTARGIAIKPGDAADALDSARADIDSGRQLQLGALPMPAGMRVWASAARMPNGHYIVTANHGEA